MALLRGLVAMGVAAWLTAAERPSVIVILADDMGLDSVSSFNPDLGLVTPRIDELVEQGMSFSDAHSGSAVCTPTRYGLLTGRYSWRSRLKRSIIPKWDAPLIEEGRLTIGAMLQQHGYHSACIGKWHLGWHWPFVDQGPVPVGDGGKLAELAAKGIDWSRPISGGPIDRGFDYHFGDDVINWEPYIYIENDRALGVPDQSAKWHDPAGDWVEDEVLPRITDKAVDYIAERSASGEPYFLYFPLTSPHSPIAPSASFRGRSGLTAYADFILETDHVVGRIVDAVDASGTADNTIIIFTADNGTALKFARQGGAADKGLNFEATLRGGKSDVYEGGHRVPFIVRWPGRVGAGTVSTSAICLTDIMATVADVVGHDLPDDAAEDSFSLMPALAGGQLQRAPVINHSIRGTFAIRDGDWKLICGAGSGGWTPPTGQGPGAQDLPSHQLYDLSADLAEPACTAPCVS
ncbi:MAG: sulfatase family protein [Planctomycetota bacterium]|jgi:arylsulfatase A-like enzyme